MTNNYPIIPSTELVQQWVSALEYQSDAEVFAQAAQWGANQELEACCELVPGLTSYLRAARRPKPPSLKKQALAVLDDCANRLDGAHENTIRRALETLDD